MIHVIGLGDRCRVRANLLDQLADLVKRHDNVPTLGRVEVTHATTVQERLGAISLPNSPAELSVTAGEAVATSSELLTILTLTVDRCNEQFSLLKEIRQGPLIAPTNCPDAGRTNIRNPTPETGRKSESTY